jgi:hypothetical protein
MAEQKIVKDEKSLESTKTNVLENVTGLVSKINDLNNNGIPDKKEKDLNNNGIPDKRENLQVHYDTFKANYLKDDIKGESAIKSYRNKYPENFSRLAENNLKKDSYNYASDYSKELKNSKNLEQKINVEAREIQSLKSNLIKGKTFGFELEFLGKVSVKELSKTLGTNIKDLNEEKKALDNLENKYKGIKDSISPKNIERNPSVYEFLQKNNLEQNNGLKKFFGIEKDFRNVTSKDLKTLLPKLEAEYNSAKKEAVGEINIIEKGGNILKDAIDLKNREVNISQTRDKLEVSKNNLEQLTRPINNLISKIIDLDFKGISEALKQTNPKDLSVFIKEAISKNKNSKDNDKIISLGEKLETLSKSNKKEANVKR